mmetsp:Transcript_27583/g.36180  ORF Transcript_27583/g.36180 Transcript_27583/m.36180 type:complete len:96 (-) Transcript_27583:202-489(-)
MQIASVDAIVLSYGTFFERGKIFSPCSAPRPGADELTEGAAFEGISSYLMYSFICFTMPLLKCFPTVGSDVFRTVKPGGGVCVDPPGMYCVYHAT